jgi:hypothetical protein
MVFSPNHNPTQKSSASPTDYNRQGWAMKTGDYENNRWFGDGIQQIKDAKTNAQASDALAIWLDRVKRDPILLAAAANQFLGKNITSDSLIKNGWSTNLAIQSAMEIEAAIGKSNVEVSNAPVDGYNTGVSNNTVVTSQNQGISGDRKAVQVTLPAQKKIWVMARCGNIALPGKPSLPPGKTDNPTPTPPTEPPVIVPPTPTTPPHHPLKPKSSNPEDYRKPGDDNTNGSGNGTMSPRPYVTSDPSTPAPVQTSRDGDGDSRVTDSPSSKPNSPSGVTAPGANNNSSGGDTPPRSVPAPAVPAPNNNGNGGDVNTGTPVNPF